MNGTKKALQVRPGESTKRVLKMRVRIQATHPESGTTLVCDVLVQAGGTATGWVPHVTEMPWTAGVLGG